MATNPEDVVRGFYACYTEGRPQDFDKYVAPDYQDYGHTPPGQGPQGARDDFEHAVQVTGGLTSYQIDALVVDDDAVAVAWTAHVPDGRQLQGLSLYRVSDGLLRSTRHTSIGAPPGR